MKLIPVMINGKYGYKNSKGDVIIKPQFDMAWGFFSGYAFVYNRKLDRYAIIDETGNFVKDYIFHYIYDLGPIITATYTKYGRYLIIDKKGDEILPPIFNSINVDSPFAGTVNDKIVKLNNKGLPLDIKSIKNLIIGVFS